MFGKSSRAYDDEDVDVANNYVLDHDDDDDGGDDGNDDDYSNGSDICSSFNQTYLTTTFLTLFKCMTLSL